MMKESKDFTQLKYDNCIMKLRNFNQFRRRSGYINPNALDLCERKKKEDPDVVKICIYKKQGDMTPDTIPSPFLNRRICIATNLHFKNGYFTSREIVYISKQDFFLMMYRSLGKPMFYFTYKEIIYVPKQDFFHMMDGHLEKLVAKPFYWASPEVVQRKLQRSASDLLKAIQSATRTASDFLNSSHVVWWSNDKDTTFPQTERLIGFMIAGTLYVPNPEIPGWVQTVSGICYCLKPVIFHVSIEAYRVLTEYDTKFRTPLTGSANIGTASIVTTANSATDLEKSAADVQPVGNGAEVVESAKAIQSATNTLLNSLDVVFWHNDVIFPQDKTEKLVGFDLGGGLIVPNPEIPGWVQTVSDLSSVVEPVIFYVSVKAYRILTGSANHATELKKSAADVQPVGNGAGGVQSATSTVSSCVAQQRGSANIIAADVQPIGTANHATVLEEIDKFVLYIIQKYGSGVTYMNFVEIPEVKERERVCSKWYPDRLWNEYKLKLMS